MSWKKQQVLLLRLLQLMKKDIRAHVCLLMGSLEDNMCRKKHEEIKCVNLFLKVKYIFLRQASTLPSVRMQKTPQKSSLILSMNSRKKTINHSDLAVKEKTRKRW